METHVIQLIGVDPAYPERLPLDLINSCPAIVASNRFQTLLPHLFHSRKSPEIINISPLATSSVRISDALQNGDVAVLASGDPLFFGIGQRLIEQFGAEVIVVHPAPSSVQYAFSRFSLPYNDAQYISLHGRNERNFIGRILSHRKTAILTDINNSPDLIAAKLYAFLGDVKSKKFSVYVAENLGMKNEKLFSGSLADAKSMQFSSLNCMLVVRNDHQPDSIFPSFGLTEEDIIHSRGLITKSEVRAAALHALGLFPQSIMWDVGAGSGSVGLEAARLQPDMLIYAVEKHPQQQDNINSNVEKFQMYNLKLIKGEAPESLHGLPRPDRIFIGGSGGNLADIINFGSKALLPGGRIVVTGVLDKTCRQAPKLLYDAGLKVETCRIEVQRDEYPITQTTTFNPITIITGRKDRQEEDL